MAEYQITYWRDIPSMVTARAGRRERAKAELPARFQEAIDEAAMRLGMAGTDAYVEAWRRGPWQEREGTPETVARAVAAQLETEYTPKRIAALVQEMKAAD
jgi:hypothetical protein